MGSIRRDFSIEGCAEIRGIIHETQDEDQWGICDWFDDIFCKDELDINNYIDNINEYRRHMIDKHDMDLQEFEKILNRVRELDISYATRLSEIDNSMMALDRKINKVTAMISGAGLSLETVKYSELVRGFNSEYEKSIIEMNEKIEAERESVEEKWYEDVLNFLLGTGTTILVDNMEVGFDVVGTILNLLPGDTDYTEVGDEAIENLDNWIVENWVTDEEAYYKGKAAGNLAGVIEVGVFLISAIEKLGKGISSFGGVAAVADGPLIIGDSVLATGLVVTGVATAGTAGLAMLSERARNKQSENLAKADEARGDKLREKVEELDGVTEGVSNPNEFNFSNEKKLNKHFEKHVLKQGEFGDITKDEYLGLANKFINSSGDDVLSKVASNGDILKLNLKTNEFSIVTKDGVIRTYHKLNPDIHGYKSNLDYWNAPDCNY